MPHPSTLALALALALAALAASPRAPAQTPAPAARTAPTALESTLELTHTLRDMMDVLTEHYAVTASLRIARSGDATLEFRGTNEFTHIRIPVPGEPYRPPPPAGPQRAETLDRWVGSARAANGGLELHFVRAALGHTPAAVDVTLQCVPQTVTVEGRSEAVYQCTTDQTMTVRAGAGYPLPPTLAVPLFLAPPATHLAVITNAASGADHRVTSVSQQFARARPAP